MSAPVETMIRTHLQTNDAVQETVEWAEIVARLETEPVQIVGPVVSPVELRQRRWRPIAVAVAAVVVLVGGVALLIRITEPDTPVVDRSIETEDASGWFRAPHNEATLGGPETQWMKSVTVGGPGFVAVGWDGENEAAVWTSVDGFEWSRVVDELRVEGPHGYPNGRINSVTSGGPGLVAVGAVFNGAMVWTSTDGTRWSPVPYDRAVFDGGAMKSVTAGGPGLVAVGAAGDDAAVWTSVDGVTWARVPHDDAVFGGPNAQTMLDVTAGGPGFVAVGRDGQGASDWDVGRYSQVAAVWTSADGTSWARVPYDHNVFDTSSTMLSVTTGGPGLVAVGMTNSGPPVWTSIDGTTWVRQFESDSTGDGVLRGVTSGGPGLVAVGWLSGSAVWTSTDGITWAPALEPAEAEEVFGGVGIEWMSSVAAGDDGVVAVGSAGFYDDGGDAAVWRLPG